MHATEGPCWLHAGALNVDGDFEWAVVNVRICFRLGTPTIRMPLFKDTSRHAYSRDPVRTNRDGGVPERLWCCAGERHDFKRHLADASRDALPDKRW